MGVCGQVPVIGIRPIIDAREGMLDVRGSLEEQTRRMAEAVRKHPHFGRSITERQAPPEEDGQPKDERRYAAIYPGVTRTQEANRILTEQYAVPRESLKSKADALREADRLNVSFPNLK